MMTNHVTMPNKERYNGEREVFCRSRCLKDRTDQQQTSETMHDERAVLTIGEREQRSCHKRKRASNESSPTDLLRLRQLRQDHTSRAKLPIKRARKMRPRGWARIMPPQIRRMERDVARRVARAHQRGDVPPTD